MENKTEMTPELQRIAIAEACGWQHCEINHHSTGMFHKGAAIGTSPDSKRTRYIPSYTTDLNAMHQAEKTLEYDKLIIMAEHISFNFAVLPFHATAAQRAEAFLRTVGKWQDE